MANPSHKAALAELFSGGTPQESTSIRLLQLVNTGLTPVEAIVVDEAFNRVVQETFSFLGERVDELAEHLRAPALIYITRGLSASIEQLDQMLIEEQMMQMAAAGIPINTGGAPDCDCRTCTAARAAQEAQRQSQTRH